MQIIYSNDGNLVGVMRDDGAFVPAAVGNRDWADYVAQNGVPPATGTPTNKPARIPLPYTTTYNALKGLTATQQNQVLGAVVSYIIVNNPQLAAQINAAFAGNGINLPFDQVNP